MTDPMTEADRKLCEALDVEYKWQCAEFDGPLPTHIKAAAERIRTLSAEKAELRKRIILASLYSSGPRLTDDENKDRSAVHLQDLIDNGWDEAEARRMVKMREDNDEAMERERQRDHERRLAQMENDPLRGYGGHYGY